MVSHFIARTLIERTLTQHVYPGGDLKSHTFDGDTCWCGPETDGFIIIHNSLDGREDYETGRRKVH